LYVQYVGLSEAGFVAAGSSQGAATSLYAAMHNPRMVRAVIMIRPPKAWERNPKKKLESADACRLVGMQNQYLFHVFLVELYFFKTYFIM
jgi:enterochelin esterase-like enzyme